MNVQERPLGAIATPALGPNLATSSGATLTGSSLTDSSGAPLDSIRLQTRPAEHSAGGESANWSQPPVVGGPIDPAQPITGGANWPQPPVVGGPIVPGQPMPGGWNAILTQLLSAIQQLLSLLGVGGSNQPPCGPNQPQCGQTYFSNASGASGGDPHLWFDGTNGAGSAQDSRFTSQTDHPDLLDSNSFNRGYRLSTAVTQPDSRGATYNRIATVGTDNGGTQVSLDKDGEATIVQNGQTRSLADGQSVNLGNGETVTRNADGTVNITDQNAQGGSITTTLSDNGKGVNATVHARSVELGGDLVNEPTANPFNDPFANPFQNQGVY